VTARPSAANSSATLITGDVRLLPETATWISQVLLTRGGSAELVTELGRLLTTTLREYPLACDLLEQHWTYSPN
jgi:MerR family transcriptional regulator, light-induced transcriptional regulator